jgi:dipeptidyl aminopeptidase/acylaminoacyl peptidase
LSDRSSSNTATSFFIRFGEEARKHLQLVLLTTDHLDDAGAGLSFLKNLPYADSQRIAVAGHSFGGQLTLLLAERDRSIRGAVAFAPAANSWDGSTELRERLLTAIRKLTVPVMLLQSGNDYSLRPTQAMADELMRLSKPYVRKIYPAVGKTANDRHNFLYTDVSQWERDVSSAHAPFP